MRAIVTGSEGFIGKALCRRLAPHFDVIHIDTKIGGDAARIEPLLADGGIDVVFHLAAETSVFNDRLDDIERENVHAFMVVATACRRHGVKKFIQASTSSIYGENAPFPTDESASSDRPLQPYAASKKGAEAECHAYHYLYDIDVTIFRFFTVYGPAGRPDMAIYRFIKWIAEGEPIQLNGDGNQTRGFTYVDDIAKGCILGLQNVGFEIMNLGGHESISINDLIHKLEKMIGREAVVEHRPVVKADMLANLADITKARKLLNWNPEVELDDGLRRTVDWYLQGRGWLKDIRI